MGGFISSLDFFTSVDFVVCLLVGAITGGLAGQIMKGGGLGRIGNVLIGMLGAAISGLLFDWINIMDIGDLLDPIIAGAIGAAIVLAIADALRRISSRPQQKDSA